MFIRAYLRASTIEQNAKRAKQSLKEFVEGFNHRIASYYIENISGNCLERPELAKLLDESERGDVLLVESIDRLSRLNPNDWRVLTSAINEKGIHVVSLDLPTSHLSFSQFPSDEFMVSILSAINSMLLEILAASAYKEYRERERKQKEGITRARSEGLYLGRKPNLDSQERIETFTIAGFSINKTAEAVGVSRSTVVRVRRKLKEQGDSHTQTSLPV